MSNESGGQFAVEEMKVSVGGEVIGGSSKSTRQAIVVLGEASESDDDEILTDHSSVIRADGQDDGCATIANKTVIVTHSNVGELSASSRRKLQQQKKPGSAHDSLLHRKLREKNAVLRQHIVQGCKQPYRSAARDLVSMTQLLVKSQSSVQESCTIVRQVTNDLFHLEDKLDIANECARHVPNISIRIPAKTPIN